LETKVSETINFCVGNPGDEREWVESLKKEIDELQNAEDFRNTHFIAVENSIDGHYLQHFFGVTIALNILRETPNAKILLYCFCPPEFVRTKKPELDLVLSYSNAYLLEAPIDPKDFQKVFHTEKKIKSKGEYTASQEAEKYLSQIFHDIKYVQNWENATDESDDPKLAKVMKLTKEYFPALSTASVTQIIDFLQSNSKTLSRTEVMKGQKLSGVYCDIEGTILIDGKLNQKVVSVLDTYREEGKDITLWTDGNIKDIQPQLITYGVTYPVKSKYDHAGAIAEIVIDDMDEYTFAAVTKISAQHFIRVSDLT